MRWHWVPSLFVLPFVAALCWLVFSDQAGAIVIFFWPLWLALRFDNDLGAFFVITVLLYLVFMVVGLLLAGLVAIATYGSVSQ
ncbi:hypothetical protein AZE99_02535 [Sphingorhabdus sp. M41]|nr:hypothetical protein AZE99_02535 [Sphingorhabdus sp. M41]